MIHCWEMTRSSLVGKGRTTHYVSDCLVHCVWPRANLASLKVISSGDINTVSSVWTICTTKLEHLSILGAYAVGKPLCTLQVPGYHLHDKREKKLGSFHMIKTRHFIFSLLVFCSSEQFGGWYQKLLELSTLSLSMPYIFKMEWKEKKKTLLNDSFYLFQIQ